MTLQQIHSYPSAPAGTPVPAAAVPRPATAASVLATMLAHDTDTLTGGETYPSLTAWQVLHALGELMPYQEDASEIELECTASDYSASRICRAVEDADATVLSLLTVPAGGATLRATLRINRADPSAVVDSLSRYGYGATGVQATHYADRDLLDSRLRELQHYLNI